MEAESEADARENRPLLGAELYQRWQPFILLAVPFLAIGFRVAGAAEFDARTSAAILASSRELDIIVGALLTLLPTTLLLAVHFLIAYQRPLFSISAVVLGLVSCLRLRSLSYSA